MGNRKKMMMMMKRSGVKVRLGEEALPAAMRERERDRETERESVLGDPNHGVGEIAGKFLFRWFF